MLILDNVSPKRSKSDCIYGALLRAKSGPVTVCSLRSDSETKENAR